MSCADIRHRPVATIAECARRLRRRRCASSTQSPRSHAARTAARARGAARASPRLRRSASRRRAWAARSEAEDRPCDSWRRCRERYVAHGGWVMRQRRAGRRWSGRPRTGRSKSALPQISIGLRWRARMVERTPRGLSARGADTEERKAERRCRRRHGVLPFQNGELRQILRQDSDLAIGRRRGVFSTRPAQNAVR